NFLKQLAIANRITLLGPASAAAFLGVSGQSQELPPPAPGEPVAGTSVEFTLYDPRADSTIREIAVHHRRTRKAGGKYTVGTEFGIRPTFGFTNVFTADTTNQAPTGVPLGGYAATSERSDARHWQVDDLIRFGTTALTESGEGAESHRFGAVGVLKITGPEGSYWIVVPVDGRTTDILPGSPRLPTRPAPAVPAGTMWARQRRAAGRSRPTLSIDADG
ncbi:hypothetical protein ACW9HQ_44755, partial [Nocardia gipuzkoensis]